MHQAGPRPVLAIGVPSFGMVHAFVLARFLNLRMPMNRIVRWFFIVGKEVGHARNEIVAKALAIEQDDPSLRCDRIMFFDDDMLFHPDVILKLDQVNRPIVSGLYYTKTSVPTPLVLHGEYEGTARQWTPGDVIDCEGHGMGLCLIDTDVFRKVRDEQNLPLDPFGLPSWFETKRDEAIVRADGVPAIYNGTEDWAFLAKARACGYQPCVDTSAQAFAWHLDPKTHTAYPPKQWDEYMRTGRITWPTKNGDVVWDNAA